MGRSPTTENPPQYTTLRVERLQKSCPGGFSRDPPRVLEFCCFYSYLFLSFYFSRRRYRCFRILKFSHFFVLFCNFLRLWRFNFRLARKGEAIPNSILPTLAAFFPNCEHGSCQLVFYLHDCYTFGIFASYLFLPYSTSRCIHRCYPR
jgi:hypothetical protein